MTRTLKINFKSIIMTKLAIFLIKVTSHWWTNAFEMDFDQVAQARLNKSGLRPLGRTQSAPLPLGHPLLQGAPGVPPPMPLTQQQFELYLRERQMYEQQQQHNMLIQVSILSLSLSQYLSPASFYSFFSLNFGFFKVQICPNLFEKFRY